MSDFSASDEALVMGGGRFVPANFDIDYERRLANDRRVVPDIQGLDIGAAVIDLSAKAPQPPEHIADT